VQRSKRIPLWQWGLLVIIAGLMANVLMSMLPAPDGAAAARGQAFGRGLATLVAIIAGVVLIVMHFVRRPAGKPRQQSRKGRGKPGPRNRR
jgi:polyferredoxin